MRSVYINSRQHVELTETETDNVRLVCEFLEENGTPHARSIAASIAVRLDVNRPVSFDQLITLLGNARYYKIDMVLDWVKYESENDALTRRFAEMRANAEKRKAESL